MTAHDMIPRPGQGNATAKFGITFDHGAVVTGYLFTNDIAPEGFVYAGVAHTYAELRVPAPAPGGTIAEKFPSSRARWLGALRDVLETAGYPAEGAGRVEVYPNPGHGTPAAEGTFDEVANVVPVLQSVFEAAGWELREVTGAAAERRQPSSRLAPPSPVCAGCGIQLPVTLRCDDCS